MDVEMTRAQERLEMLRYEQLKAERGVSRLAKARRDWIMDDPVAALRSLAAALDARAEKRRVVGEAFGVKVISDPTVPDGEIRIEPATEDARRRDSMYRYEGAVAEALREKRCAVCGVNGATCACPPAPSCHRAPLCCARAGEYNGYGSDGPTTFTCPAGCSCHD